MVKLCENVSWNLLSNSWNCLWKENGEEGGKRRGGIGREEEKRKEDKEERGGGEEEGKSWHYKRYSYWGSVSHNKELER